MSPPPLRVRRTTLLHTALPRLARALAVLALVAGLAPGCGYHQDVPHLPGRAHTVALERVNNLTDTAELDVRLRVLLQQRLSRQAYVHLEPAHRSELGLTVDLQDLSVTRAIDPARGTVPSVSYALSGLITLVDLRTGHTYIDQEPIKVAVNRVYSATQLETPAVQDDGVNAVLEAFAKQVQEQIGNTF